MLKKAMFGLILFLFCLVSQQAQAELVSEWKFDGNAEDSKGSNHGTLIGNPTWVPNRFGDQEKALSFDGKNDYVDCGNDASLSFGNGTKDSPFSIEAWVNMNTYKKFAFVEKEKEYSLCNSNSFRFWLFSEEGHIGRRAAGVFLNYEKKWTHLVVTYDGSSTDAGIVMYVNGVVKRSSPESGDSYTAMENHEGAFRIGKTKLHGCRANGSFDDVKVYNHVLSPEKVKILYFQSPTSLVKADTHRKLSVQRISIVPEIDGNLSDKVWKEERWYSGFHILNHPQQIAKPGTSFAMAHDGENLYIAVRADEPEIAKTKALVSKRDGPVWKDDSIEIFIDSKGEGIYHYQFVINSKGSLYDTKATRGGMFNKSDWNSDIKVATSVGEDAWFLEVSIPFYCLSFSPENLSTWRFNIGRSRFVTSKRELFTYAPLQGTFHDSKNFALVHIKNIDLSPFLLDFDLEGIKGILKQGQVVANAKILIKNNSSLPRKIDITAILTAGDKETSTILRGIRFNQGTYHQDITIPLHATREGTLVVSLQDVKSGKVVCSQWFSVALDYTPLKVEVLPPIYRNAIFSGQKLKDIELEVITALAPKERKDYLFKFSLNSDQKVLCSQSSGIRDEKMNISIPLPGLKTGSYLINSSLVHKPTGNTLANWQEVLRKLPPKKGEVSFDENMVCLIDNKPFLPFGISNMWSIGTEPQSSAVNPGIQEAAEIGCNTVEHFGALRWGTKDIDKYFDELHQSGLKLIAYPHPQGFPLIRGGEKLSKPLTSKEEEILRSHLQKIRHYPEILAWYIGNEPEPSAVNPKRMKQIDDIIKGEDPYHPTVIAFHNIRNIKYFADATVVLWPDPYPGFMKDGGWIRPQFTTKAIEEAVKVSKGRKPVWAFLQAQDMTLFGRVDQRAPNFADLRNQLYQAAIAGAKGFFWYCRWRIEPQVKIGLTYLAKESQLLREVIFAPESLHKFSVAKDTGKSAELHLSRRQVGKDTYLFTVSSSGKKREIEFKASGLSDRQLFVVGEGREVRLQRGEFTDSFEPYDTHIYTTNKSLAYRLSIANVYKEIKDTCTPVIKPGNLAHKSRGTTIRFSKKTTNRLPPLNFVIDGIKTTSFWGGRGKRPSWVEIIFTGPEKVCKVLIDSNICHLQVEVENNGAWIRVADAKIDRSSLLREVQTVKFPLVETKKIRLHSLMDAIPQIWEIEVYGEKK